MTERDNGSCSGLTSAIVVIRDFDDAAAIHADHIDGLPGLSGSVDSFAARTGVVPMSFGS